MDLQYPILARLSRRTPHLRSAVAQQFRHVAQHRARVNAETADSARATLADDGVGVGERRHRRACV